MKLPSPRSVVHDLSTEEEAATGSARRKAAAARYRPTPIRTLLVAEAPPRGLSRYFYFEHVGAHDSLFRNVFRTMMNKEPDRKAKARHLAELKTAGVFLIDLKESPADDSPLADSVPGLVERCAALSAERIILIKVTVYDAAFAALKSASLPVINCRIPFPGSGQQRRFEEEFRAALQMQP